MNFQDFLNENINFRQKVKRLGEMEKKTPSIFSHTIYRLPTEEELEEVNSCDLNADEITKGFGYTIIGRGINSEKNRQMIKDSIQLLCNLYPENVEYAKALETASASL